MNKAIVLLSGGLDSATALYHAKSTGYKPFCLIFDYGQRHRKEIAQAVKIARRCGAEYAIAKISLPWKGSSLLDAHVRLPENRADIAKNIPTTYVPSRNTIFLSFAMSWAEAIGAEGVFIGANAVDYSGYPDCRPEYFRQAGKLFSLGTKSGVEGENIRIHTPLITKTKAGIIKMGLKLGVPYGLTWSCYKGGRRPCGSCDSCILRAKGFKEAGVEDPLIS